MKIFYLNKDQDSIYVNIQQILWFFKQSLNKFCSKILLLFFHTAVSKKIDLIFKKYIYMYLFFNLKWLKVKNVR